MRRQPYMTFALACALLPLTACSDGDAATTRFQITVRNTITTLSTAVFNTPDGATEPGPVTAVDGSYSVSFRAAPGANVSFFTMQANSNDWFFAPLASGIALYDADGQPITGDVSSMIYLWDAGTEAEDPATFATEPDGGTAGAPDTDNRVRAQETDVTSMLRTELAYDAGEFTLTLTRLGDAILTPGLLVVHAGETVVFADGLPDTGYGLEAIAEAGNPMPLYDFLNGAGSTGAPVHRSLGLSPLSPGLAYTFSEGTSDPLFSEGEAAAEGSGLEALAEDGNNAPALAYLDGLGVAAVPSGAMGVGPGGALVFEIEASPGDQLGFATMFVQSNDWFVAFNNAGVALFDADGAPNVGLASTQAYLFDAGTEADEAIGLGANQPMRGGAESGDDDSDTMVRRVSSAEDTRGDGGVFSSAAGVAGNGDPRGGYGLVEVEISLAR